MKKQLTTKQILQKAKRILLKDGWCRFNFTDSRGRHCLMGALQKAAHGRCSAMLYIPELLEGALRQPDGYSPMYFNDHVARDRRAVVRVLDGAIANA